MFAGKLLLPHRSRTFIIMYLQPLPKERHRFDIRSPALVELHKKISSLASTHREYTSDVVTMKQRSPAFLPRLTKGTHSRCEKNQPSSAPRLGNAELHKSEGQIAARRSVCAQLEERTRLECHSLLRADAQLLYSLSQDNRGNILRDLSAGPTLVANLFPAVPLRRKQRVTFQDLGRRDCNKFVRMKISARQGAGRRCLIHSRIRGNFRYYRPTSRRCEIEEQISRIDGAFPQDAFCFRMHRAREMSNAVGEARRGITFLHQSASFRALSLYIYL